MWRSGWGRGRRRIPTLMTRHNRMTGFQSKSIPQSVESESPTPDDCCGGRQTAIGVASKTTARRRIVGWKERSGYQLAWIPQKASHGLWIQSFKTRSKAIRFLRDQGNCLLIEPSMRAEEIVTNLENLLQCPPVQAVQQSTILGSGSQAGQPANDALESNRVIVTWLIEKTRHIAWGNLGSSIIAGHEECTYPGRYEALLETLLPYNCLIAPLPNERHLSIDVGRSIAQGCFVPLRPPETDKPRRKPKEERGPGLRPKDFCSDRPSNLEQATISDELQRNEALVVRPNGPISSSAALRRRSEQAAAKESERQLLLREQRKELRRLEWYRERGIDIPDAPDDLMRRTLQGGAPGLKK